MPTNLVGSAAVLLSTIAICFFTGSDLAAQSSIPDILVSTTSDVVDFSGAQQVADLPGADGVVSLREAIIASNNTAEPQVIGFNIPTSDVGFDGTVFTIRPQNSTLPPLSDHATTIDGHTQTLFTGDTNSLGPEVVLDGSQAGPGSGILIFRSSYNILRGLVIHSFEEAAVQFGFDPNEPTVTPDNNRVVQCYIGTDETGSILRGNGWQGIAVNGRGNIIGGSGPAEGNLISGNTIAGVDIGNMAIDTRLEGNLIGTDRTGTLALGNIGLGVLISGGSNSVIGGAAETSRNIISGNIEHGVAITGSGNRVEGNFIGTDITGENPLPNNVGIQIVFDATRNVILRNRIAFNLSDGIAVGFSATRNRISGNSIFSNAGLAVDLGNGGADDFHGDGVTPNDPADNDSGPNHLINFPTLTSAHAAPGRLVVHGEIDIPKPKTVLIEFFANAVPTPGGDPSGHGEGEIFLGTGRPNSRGRFTVPLPPLPVGVLISATATDADGNTSEFARNIVARLP